MPSLYQVSVPVFSRQLASMADILDRAVPFLAERAIPETALLDTSLYPNMYPFWMQVNRTVFHAMSVSLLAGREQPYAAQEMKSLKELQGLVAEGLAFLKAIGPAEFDGPQDREVSFRRPAGVVLRFKASDFLMSFALPNFFFHHTTAYNILRRTGLEIGKRDFLGNLPKITD
jgi:hypothetical protein